VQIVGLWNKKPAKLGLLAIMETSEPMICVNCAKKSRLGRRVVVKQNKMGVV
jgi:hypothetical protein